MSLKDKVLNNTTMIVNNIKMKIDDFRIEKLSKLNKNIKRYV